MAAAPPCSVPVMLPESVAWFIPGNQGLDAVDVPRGGNGGEDVLADRLLRPRALDVDDRRFAGDGDRFLERADFQVAVDRRDERARQLDAFALDGAEARQRERHRVGARPQVDDAVLAGVVADDGADLLDQDRARGFHRDAR